MNEEILQRISESLERIATALENRERREINERKKTAKESRTKK